MWRKWGVWNEELVLEVSATAQGLVLGLLSSPFTWLLPNVSSQATSYSPSLFPRTIFSPPSSLYSCFLFFLVCFFFGGGQGALLHVACEILVP